jgi:hypothetical protein
VALVASWLPPEMSFRLPGLPWPQHSSVNVPSVPMPPLSIRQEIWPAVMVAASGQLKPPVTMPQPAARISYSSRASKARWMNSWAKLSPGAPAFWMLSIETWMLPPFCQLPVLACHQVGLLAG